MQPSQSNGPPGKNSGGVNFWKKFGNRNKSKGRPKNGDPSDSNPIIAKKDNAVFVEQEPQLQSTSPEDRILMTNFLNRSDYEDPITYQIMADPVTSFDGHTYDRFVIERCFQDRIQAEKEREQRGNTDNSGTAAVCCGRKQQPLELLSPMTNEIVSDVLVPNLILEKQIVRLMEANAFQLSREEIEDWEERRRQKKSRDRQQQELRRRKQEMSQNAQEQGENDNNNMNTHSQGILEISGQVQFDPDNKRLVVALAQPGIKFPMEFFNGSHPRCMVLCCARRLDDGAVPHSYKFCARCARLVCHDCLALEVADIQSVHHRDDQVYKICVDCVTNLVDLMEISPDIYLRQQRVLLLRMLETQTTRFSNQLAQLQEQLLRFEANNFHSPKLMELEYDIDRWKERQSGIQNRTKRTSALIAAETQEECDEDVARLRAECQEIEKELMRLVIEKELADLQGNRALDNESEHVVGRSVESVKFLTYRLEKVRTELARVLPAQNQVDEGPSCSIDEVNSLEKECEQLECRYTKLSMDLVSDLDIVLALELNLVGTQLEETQKRLAMARSNTTLSTRNRNRTFPGSSGLEISLPHTTHFIDAVARARLKKKPTKRKMSGFAGRKSINEDDVFQRWLVSTILIKNEVPKTTSRYERGSKMNDLLTQLSKVPLFFSCDECEILGLPTACTEVEKLMASPATTNDGQQQQQVLTKSDTSEIFPDYLAEMLLPCGGDTKSRQSENFPDLITTPPIRRTKSHEANIFPDSLAYLTPIPSTRPKSGESKIFPDSLADLIPMHPGQTASRKSESFRSTQDFVSPVPIGFTGTAVGFNPSESGLDKHDMVNDFEDVRSDLNAVGTRYEQWALPLNLKYPTPRMVQQLDLLQKTLDLCKVESQRIVEGEWEERFHRLTVQKQELEDWVIHAKQRAVSMNKSAKGEERWQRDQAEEHRQREMACMEQERVRRKKTEQKAEREREELILRHWEEEAATQSTFAKVIGKNNCGAEFFGGIGDLRMCKRCRTGPIENQACPDLEAHNNTSTTYRNSPVYSNVKPNHCPNCDWFSSDWHEWPYWDGVYGPH